MDKITQHNIDKAASAIADVFKKQQERIVHLQNTLEAMNDDLCLTTWQLGEVLKAYPQAKELECFKDIAECPSCCHHREATAPNPTDNDGHDA